LGVQQAQLGQGAAGLYRQAAQQYGNLASQQGALAGQEAAINQNIANLLLQQGGQRIQAGQAQAGIYGQQAGQFQNIAQGIGQLAGQQFGIGQSTAQGLGQFGQQLGQLGVQQAALGQTAQALQQGDVNFLFNVGQAQQALNQQQLDAQRANTLQSVYAPYQQASFLSDIYRGAPSSQMSTTAASQPSASPFQQAVGIGLGAVATAAGAKRAGIF
jgi:glucose-6-phosphate-specific signal transduction histidine kinase